MIVQCEDGRDEAGHCPHTSPACPGWVAVQHKCYKIFTAGKLSLRQARDVCRAHGFELASVKGEQEIGGALALLRRWNTSAVFGLTCGLYPEHMLYRYNLIWFDKTVVYKANHFGQFIGLGWAYSFRAYDLRERLNVV